MLGHGEPQRLLGGEVAENAWLGQPHRTGHIVGCQSVWAKPVGQGQTGGNDLSLAIYRGFACQWLDSMLVSDC